MPKCAKIVARITPRKRIQKNAQEPRLKVPQIPVHRLPRVDHSWGTGKKVVIAHIARHFYLQSGQVESPSRITTRNHAKSSGHTAQATPRSRTHLARRESKISPMIVRWALTEKGKDAFAILMMITVYGLKWNADLGVRR
jgi:hypothetical protein